MLMESCTLDSIDDAMIRVQLWRQDATANANSNTRTQGNRVRTLRPVHADFGKREAEEKSCREAKEGQGQSKSLALALAAPLAFKPLPLHGDVVFAGESFPGKTPSDDLAINERE